MCASKENVSLVAIALSVPQLGLYDQKSASDGNACMNPFPFPLSSLVAQAVAAGILVILSVIILSYLFLLFRRKKFVPVRGFLMDRSATARGHFFYEYEVKGGALSMFCFVKLVNFKWDRGVLYRKKGAWAPSAHHRGLLRSKISRYRLCGSGG
tara:strand:+ start:675 stop:1136 length:462 start_codon:yes stop_codon:yes gene_type:complete